MSLYMARKEQKYRNIVNKLPILKQGNIRSEAVRDYLIRKITQSLYRVSTFYGSV